MAREEVVKQLMDFLLCEFPGQGGELSEDTNLLSDWFMDSLGTLELAMFLEEAFDVDVRREDINGDNFYSISTLADFVLSRASG